MYFTGGVILIWPHKSTRKSMYPLFLVKVLQIMRCLVSMYFSEMGLKQQGAFTVHNPLGNYFL